MVYQAGLRWTIAVVFLLTLAHSLVAAEWYVRADAAGGGDGSEEAPFTHISQATALAVAGDTIHILPGIYREILRPATGTATDPLRILGRPGTVISGHDPIYPGVGGNGLWQHQGDGLWSIDLDPSLGLLSTGLGGQQLRVDGQWYQLARWPTVPAGRVFCHDREFLAQALSGGIEEDSEHSFEDYPQTHVRGHYMVSDLPPGNWQHARADLAPGDGWWQRTGTVLSAGDGRIDFAWPAILGDWAHREVPGPGDWFSLWGRLAALDTVGEFFHDLDGHDGPARRLYVRFPASFDPANADIEIRKREVGANLSDRSYVILEDIQFIGAAFQANDASRSLTLRRLEFDHAAQELDIRRWPLRTAISLRGSGHVVDDCQVMHVYGRGIDMRQADNTVRNSVVGYTSDHGIGTDHSRGATVERNTVFDGGNTVISISGVASAFTHNRVYRAGLRIIDVAVMNTWNSGDMEGTQIAWNWVYDGLAPLSHSETHQWNGSQGIRLDGGGAPLGCSNAIIHHNVVWNTSSPASIAVWAMAPGQENEFDSKVRVYHNSGMDSMVVNHNGQVLGHDIRNNIFRNLRWNTNAPIGDAILSSNLFIDEQRDNNVSGAAGWLSGWRRDLRLADDAWARAKGELIEAIAPAINPDLGAYAHGEPRWEPGALISERHLSQLRAHYERSLEGQARIRIDGLPIGRALPQGAVLRLAGSIVSSDLYHRFVTSTHRAQAVFTLGDDSLSGDQAVELSLDGSTFHPVGSVRCTPPQLLGFDREAIGSDGEQDLGIVAQGMQWLSRSHLQAVPVPDGDGESLLNGPIPLRFSSTEPIADGTLAADGSNLRVLIDNPGDDPVVLDHYLQSGLGSDHTLLWVTWPQGTELAWYGLSGPAPLWLSFGESELEDRADPELLSRFWPMLADPSLLAWLHGNDLAADSAVAQWSDRSGAGNHGVQTTPSQQPVAARAEGLAGLRFDGIDDHLLIPALGIGPMHHFIVYRNPDPGTENYQRLLSSREDTSTTDYQGMGHYQIIDTDNGPAIPRQQWVIKRGSNDNTAASRNNMTLGRYSISGNSPFRGDIAEVLLFDRVLTTAERQQVNAYLQQLTAAHWDGDSGMTVTPLSVRIGDQLLEITAVDGEGLRVRIPAGQEGELEIAVQGGDFGPQVVPGLLRVVDLVRSLWLWVEDGFGPLPVEVRLDGLQQAADGAESPAHFPGRDAGTDQQLSLHGLGEPG